MAVKITVQKDYFTTEVSVQLPTQVSDWDEVMKATKSNGKMVVLYNQGSVQGISIEQRTKVSETLAPEIRALLGVNERIL